ncbi:hypothetical protein MLD38_014726 [Melastoma candidum]|uniref:Uncharacterized protein n=1 Tax=Melastoma candidum TaxID=119954 RepID=A0ACB9RGT9_9MYRT|nr:hypothetical protein MLD38_014726 [Melastoma candidum]
MNSSHMIKHQVGHLMKLLFVTALRMKGVAERSCGLASGLRWGTTGGPRRSCGWELLEDGVGVAVGSDWRTESRVRWGAIGGVGELLEDGVEGAVGSRVGVGELLEDGIAAVGSYWRRRRGATGMGFVRGFHLRFGDV